MNQKHTVQPVESNSQTNGYESFFFFNKVTILNQSDESFNDWTESYT